MKIASTEQMREIDRLVFLDDNFSNLILIENTACQLIRVLENNYGPMKEKKIAVVCGKGNNGGDGLAIARHLSQFSKAHVQILLVEEAEAFKGEALLNYKMALNLKIKIQPAKDFEFKEFHFIIDAIYGTGLKGFVNESTSRIIEKMNLSGQKIISVDVPSGLDSNTGTTLGVVIKATLTVTLSFMKYGLLVYPGADYSGEIVVIDIGISDRNRAASEINKFTVESSDVREWLQPRKNRRDTNKSSYGHVVVFAGSRGFAGAAILVAEAAQRAGAGLVTLAVPDELEKEISSRVSPVIMTSPLSQARDSSFSAHAVPEALALIESSTFAALGPGLGLGDQVAEFVLEFVARCKRPLVIDADALTLLSQTNDHGQSIIKNRQASTILTPHPAELGRLLGITTESIQNDRLAAIQLAVKKFGCVVLLKGTRTLISDTSEKIYLNLTGNPGLSSAGSGDTLTGIIAAMLAQNLEALPAAAAAAFLHGLAADLVAQKIQGCTGIIATDIISYLPLAIAKCQRVSL